MSVFVGILLFVLLIGGIIYGYYSDYKRDKKTFTVDLKSISARLLYVVIPLAILLVVDKAREAFLPVYTDFGIEHNKQREHLSIPLIPEDWQELPYLSSQYTKWYGPSEPDSTEFHFKKMIEFNYWSAIYEEDHYVNPQSKERVTAKYSYRTSNQEYFISKLPGSSEVDVSHDISLVMEHLNTLTRTQISKKRFNQLLYNWKESNAILEQ